MTKVSIVCELDENICNFVDNLARFYKLRDSSIIELAIVSPGIYYIIANIYQISIYMLVSYITNNYLTKNM